MIEEIFARKILVRRSLSLKIINPKISTHTNGDDEAVSQELSLNSHLEKSREPLCVIFQHRDNRNNDFGRSS